MKKIVCIFYFIIILSFSVNGFDLCIWYTKPDGEVIEKTSAITIGGWYNNWFNGKENIDNTGTDVWLGFEGNIAYLERIETDFDHFVYSLNGGSYSEFPYGIKKLYYYQVCTKHCLECFPLPVGQHCETVCCQYDWVSVLGNSQGVNITNEGEYDISIKAIYDNGTESSPIGGTIRIDKSPPQFPSGASITQSYDNGLSSNSVPGFGLSWTSATDAYSGMKRYGVRSRNVTDSGTWSPILYTTTNLIPVVDFSYIHRETTPYIDKFQYGSNDANGDGIINDDDKINIERRKVYEIQIYAEDNLGYISSAITGTVFIPMNPLIISSVTYDSIPVKNSTTIEYNYHIKYEKVIKQKNPLEVYDWNEYLNKLTGVDIDILYVNNNLKITDDVTEFSAPSIASGSYTTWQFEGDQLVFSSKLTGNTHKHQKYKFKSLIKQTNATITDCGEKSPIPSIIPNYPADYSVNLTKCVKVFSENNFSGSGILLAPGNYTLAALRMRGIYDNTISSIQIPDGFKVSLYRDDNFPDPSPLILFSSAAVLPAGTDNQGMDNTVSSLKIENISGFPAQWTINPYVSCYQNCDYAETGYKVKLTPGDYKTDLLDDLGFKVVGDKEKDESYLLISSIKIPVGFKVTLYDGVNLTGSFRVLTNNDACFTDNGWDNCVSSISIEANVTCYDNTNFSISGGYRIMLFPGNYRTADLINLGINDNSLSSIKIPSGFRGTLYENGDFSGSSWILTGDDADFTDNGWNNRASSIKVEKLNVTCYENSNYAGGSSYYTIQLLPGNYNLNMLQQLGILDNSMSSIKVPLGFKVIFYDGSDFNGSSWILTGDDDNFADNGWNDRVSSIKVEKDNLILLPNTNNILVEHLDFRTDPASKKVYDAEDDQLKYKFSFANITNGYKEPIPPPGDSLYKETPADLSPLRNIQGEILGLSSGKYNCSVDVGEYTTISYTPQQAAFYKNFNFQGSSIELGPGVYYGSDLKYLGFYECISSVKIPAGQLNEFSRLKVTLYDEDYCTGRSLVLNYSDDDLSNDRRTIISSWNNDTKSISIEITITNIQKKLDDTGFYDQDSLLPYLNSGWNFTPPGSWRTDQTTGNFEMHFDLNKPAGEFHVIALDEDRMLASDKPVKSKTVRLYVPRYSRPGNLYSGSIFDRTGPVDSGVKDMYIWDIDSSFVPNFTNIIDTVNALENTIKAGFGKTDFETNVLPSIDDPADRTFVYPDCFELKNIDENGTTTQRYVLKDTITDEKKEQAKDILKKPKYRELNVELAKAFYNRSAAAHVESIPLNIASGESFPQATVNLSGWTNPAYFPARMRAATLQHSILPLIQEAEDRNFIQSNYEPESSSSEFFVLKQDADKARVARILKGIGYLTWRIGEKDNEYSYGSYHAWTIDNNTTTPIDEYRYIGMKLVDSAGNSYYTCQVVRVDMIKPLPPVISTVNHTYGSYDTAANKYIEFYWEKPILNELEGTENDILDYIINNNPAMVPTVYRDEVSGKDMAKIRIPTTDIGANEAVTITIISIDPAGNVSDNSITYRAYTPAIPGSLQNPVQGYNSTDGHYIEWGVNGGTYTTAILQYQASATQITPNPLAFATGASSSANTLKHTGLFAHNYYYYRLKVTNHPPCQVSADGTEIPFTDAAHNAKEEIKATVSEIPVANQVPAAPVISAPGNYISQSSIFRWTHSGSDVDNDTVTYNLKLYDSTGTTIREATGLTITEWSLPSGVTLEQGSIYTLEIQAIDTYGGASPPATKTFIADMTDPQITESGLPPADIMYTNLSSFIVNITDELSGVAKYEYKRGDVVQDTQNVIEYNQNLPNITVPLVHGYCRIELTAFDHAGNDTQYINNELRVDLSPPVTGDISIAPRQSYTGTYNCTNKKLPVQFTLTDVYSGIHGFSYRFIPARSGYSENEVIRGGFVWLDDGASVLNEPFTEYAITFDDVLSITGDYTQAYLLGITPIDWAGNEGDERISTTPVFFDSSPPVITGPTITTPYDHIYVKSLDEISVSFTYKDPEWDPESGVTPSYSIIRDGFTGEPVWYDRWEDAVSHNASGLLEGERYRVKCKAVNGVGLASADVSSVFVLDNTGPDISGVYIEPSEKIVLGDQTIIIIDKLIPGDQVKITIDTEELNPDGADISTFRLAIGTEDVRTELTSRITGNVDGRLESTNNVFYFTVPGIEDGTYRIYISIEDALGRVAENNSNTIDVDTTQQRMVVRNTGMFSTNNACLSGEWFYYGESIPSKYMYRLVTDNSIETDWIQSGLFALNTYYWNDYSRQMAYGSAAREYFTDGVTYYFEAKAVFADGGESSVRRSLGFMVDSTPPDIEEQDGFVVPFACKAENLTVSWNTTDSESSIKKVELIYNVFSLDQEGIEIPATEGILLIKNITNIENKTSIGESVPISFKDDEGKTISLDSGIRIRMILRVTNRAGLSTDSDTFVTIIDNSTPEVTVFDQGVTIFAGNADKPPQYPQFWWKASDNQSSIVKYEWAVCYDEFGNDIKTWYAPNEEEIRTKKVRIEDHPETGLIPAHELEVFFAVRATNNAGLQGIGISNGITYDDTAPKIYDISLLNTNNEDVDFIMSTNNLRLAFDAEEDVSIIEEYKAMYGRLDASGEYIQNNTRLYISTDDNIIQLDPDNDPASSDIIEGTPIFEPGTEYAFKGECWNNIGLVGYGLSDPIVLDNMPPVVQQVECDKGNRKLHFSWLATISYAPIKAYEIALYYKAKSIDTAFACVRNVYIESLDETGEVQTYYDFDNLSDGVYYLTVTARSVIGIRSQAKTSREVILDSTPAFIKTFSYPDFASRKIALYLTAEDDLSIIDEYQFGIGTIDDPFAITGKWETGYTDEEDKITGGVFDKVIFFEGFPAGFDGVMDGAKVYVSVRVKNNAGVWSNPSSHPSDLPSGVSGPIVIDKSSPSVPTVTYGGRYATYENMISGVDFSSFDNESGIAAYRTVIVKNTNDALSGDCPWNIIEEVDEFTTYIDMKNRNIEGDTSESGTGYYIAVQTKNNAGDWSDPGFSSEIIADLDPPDVWFERQGEEIIVNEIPADITYHVEEEVSEPVELRFELVPPSPTLPESYQPIEKSSGTHTFIFDKEAYGVYCLKVVAFDQAGNRYPEQAGVEPPTQVIRVNQPPVITFQQMITYPGKPIRLSAFVYDPDDDEPFAYEWQCRKGIPRQIDALRFETDVIQKILIETDRNLVRSYYAIDPSYGTYVLRTYFNEADSMRLSILFESIAYVSYEAEPLYVFFHTNPQEPFTDHEIELRVTDAGGKKFSKKTPVEVHNTSADSLYVNEYWSHTFGSKAHQIWGDIIVPQNITLTILPGSTVWITGNESIGYNHQIVVEGDLEMQSGAVIEKHEESNALWDGIYVKGKAHLDSARISDADYGIVVFEGAVVEAYRSTFSRNNIGVYVFNNSPVIDSCAFENNFIYGIKEDMGMRPKVADCTFVNNRFDYYHQSITVMTGEEINDIDSNSNNSTDKE